MAAIGIPVGAEKKPPVHPDSLCECGGELIWFESYWVCRQCGEEWEEIRPGDVLSPTQVRCYQDCAARWRFKYVDHLPEPKTSSLALGIAVHEAIGLNFAAKIETSVDLPAAEVVEQFRQAWDGVQAAIEFRDEENPQSLMDAGAGLVELFMREASPAIQPAAVEVAFGGRIGGVEVQGRVDLLDTDGRIVDIKTAQRKPSELEPSQVFQLATYDQLTPGACGESRIYTLVRTKTPQLVQHTRRLTGLDYAAIERQYPLIQKAMRSEVHVPNRCSMLCSRRNCAFWRACEAEYGGEVPLS